MIAELESYADEMCLAERLYREGALPKRICHCDTKVNNMMFDKDGKVLCVIDLDTVMPSFIFSDYGDFLRTGANHVAEDSDNYDAVGLKEDVFCSFTEAILVRQATSLLLLRQVICLMLWLCSHTCSAFVSLLITSTETFISR